MERLTETRDAQWVIPLRQDGKHKWALCKAGLSCDDSTEYLYGDHANKLAAYEETGLTPEQVKDMDENARTSLLTWFEAHYGCPIGELMGIMEAKQENRLVALPPCKVGDDVWIIYEDEIHKLRVQGMSLTVSNKVLLHFGGYPITCIYALEQGKKWFLSREEAEDVLKERL